jgi:hypothetical protein
MKDRSIGERTALALAAAAIGFGTGFVFWIIFSLFITIYELELVYKVVSTAVGLGVMIYLAYKWSGKRIALIAATVFIMLVILGVVIDGAFMWSAL